MNKLSSNPNTNFKLKVFLRKSLSYLAIFLGALGAAIFTILAVFNFYYALNARSEVKNKVDQVNGIFTEVSNKLDLAENQINSAEDTAALQAALERINSVLQSSENKLAELLENPFYQLVLRALPEVQEGLNGLQSFETAELNHELNRPGTELFEGFKLKATRPIDYLQAKLSVVAGSASKIEHRLSLYSWLYLISSMFLLLWTAVAQFALLQFGRGRLPRTQKS